MTELGECSQHRSPWPISLRQRKVIYICVNKLTILDSDTGLSPGRRQAIIWTNVRLLILGTLGTRFSRILIEIDTFLFKKIHLKMSPGKWRPFYLGLNVLMKGRRVNSTRMSQANASKFYCTIECRYNTVQKWLEFSRLHFENIFMTDNFVFWWKFNWNLSLVVGLQCIHVSPDNGLVPKRRQAITLTRIHPDLWRHMAAISRVCLKMTSSNGCIFRVTGPLCGEFTGPGEFPAQRPVTRSFDVFFDLRLNKRLSKQPRGWWFETPSWSLWRHRNVRNVANVEIKRCHH